MTLLHLFDVFHVICHLLIYGFNAPPLAALFSGCEFVLK